jgi:hypothetical protein
VKTQLIFQTKRIPFDGKPSDLFDLTFWGLKTWEISQDHNHIIWLKNLPNLKRLWSFYCGCIGKRKGFILYSIPDVLHSRLIGSCIMDTKSERTQVKVLYCSFKRYHNLNSSFFLLLLGLQIGAQVLWKHMLVQYGFSFLFHRISSPFRFWAPDLNGRSQSLLSRWIFKRPGGKRHLQARLILNFKLVWNPFLSTLFRVNILLRKCTS